MIRIFRDVMNHASTSAGQKMVILTNVIFILSGNLEDEKPMTETGKIITGLIEIFPEIFFTITGLRCRSRQTPTPASLKKRCTSCILCQILLLNILLSDHVAVSLHKIGGGSE